VTVGVETDAATKARLADELILRCPFDQFDKASMNHLLLSKYFVERFLRPTPGSKSDRGSIMDGLPGW
jgi:hypothetical protein